MVPSNPELLYALLKEVLFCYHIRYYHHNPLDFCTLCMAASHIDATFLSSATSIRSCWASWEPMGL